MLAKPTVHINGAVGRGINALNRLEEALAHCIHRQREKWRTLVIPDQALDLLYVRPAERAMNLNGRV